MWHNYPNYQNSADFHEQQVISDKNLVTANGTAALAFTAAVLQLIHFQSSEELTRTIDLYRLGFYQYCQNMVIRSAKFFQKLILSVKTTSTLAPNSAA